MKKLFFIATLMLSIALVFTACAENDNKETTAQLAKGEIYTCEMHNEVMSDHAGECPKCGMELEKQQMTAAQQKLMNEGTYVKPKQ